MRVGNHFCKGGGKILFSLSVAVFAVALVALIFSMRYYIGWIFTSDE